MKYKFIFMYFILFFCITSVTAFPSTNLTAYWNFGQSSGIEPDKVDGTSNISSGDFIGVTRGVNGGVVGKSIRLDGNDDYFNISQNINEYNLTSIAISFWFNWTGETATGDNNGLYTLISFHNQSAESKSMFLNIDNRSSGRSNGLYFQIYNKRLETGATFPDTFDLTKWHNIILVKNITSWGLWVDGTLRNSTTAIETNLSNLVNQGGNLRWSTNNYFGYDNITGCIDEIGIWNYSLTANEILDIYNNGTAGIGYLPRGASVSLDDPDDSSYLMNTIVFNSTITPTNITLKNATLYLYYENGTLFNKTTNSLTGTSVIITTFNATGIPPQSYFWNVYACGNKDSGSSLCSFAESNNTFNYGYKINSETYDTSVGDLSNATFIINITLQSGLTATANLIYNGTSYLATKTTVGGDTIFTNNIDIPPVNSSSSKNFFWTLFLTNHYPTSGVNTTERTQTVTPSRFVKCSTTWPVVAVNFSVWDEDKNTIINASQFDVSFKWKLSSTSSYTKNVSYDLANEYSYTFCISPNSTFVTDVNLKISATGYASRIFTMESKSYSNISTSEKLYLLNSSDSKTVIIEVQNKEYSPLNGYTVKIYRYNPSDGSYSLIQQDVTDEYGQIIANLVENNVEYKFEFYDESMVLIKSTEKLKIACRSTICILPFTVEVASDYFDEYNNLTSYDYSLSFDNSTNIFTFTWNDNTGKSPTHRLEVTRFAFNGSTIVCNTTSTSIVGSLTCNVGGSKASYGAQAFRIIGSDERRIALINVKVGDISSVFGIEGMFVSFILLFTLITVGLFSPAIGIILYMGGIVVLWITGIVYIDTGILIAQTVIGILFIWSFRS